MVIPLIMLAGCQSASVGGLFSPEWLTDASGEYAGLLSTPNGNGEITTVLDEVGGEVSGTYSYEIGGSKFTGKLTDCKAKAGFRLECSWQENSSNGKARFTFKRSMKSFAGTWKMKGEKRNYNWNGIKKIAVPQLV